MDRYLPQLHLFCSAMLRKTGKLFISSDRAMGGVGEEEAGREFPYLPRKIREIDTLASAPSSRDRQQRALARSRGRVSRPAKTKGLSRYTLPLARFFKRQVAPRYEHDATVSSWRESAVIRKLLSRYAHPGRGQHCTAIKHVYTRRAKRDAGRYITPRTHESPNNSIESSSIGAP